MTPLLLAAVLVTATPDAVKPEPCPLFWDEVEYSAGHEFPPDQRAILTDNWNHYDPPSHDTFAHIYAVLAEGELERMLTLRAGSGL